MSRGRAYRRDMRNRAIARKKQLSHDVYGLDWFRVDAHILRDILVVAAECVSLQNSMGFLFRMKQEIENM